MRVLVITHIADMDGRGNEVLAKLVFDDVTTILIEPSDMLDTIQELIKTNEYKKYDQIFITDLGIKLEAALIIDKYFKDKVLHFDHHITDMIDKNFSWSTVIEKDNNGFQPCGTSLFYEYLLEVYPTNLVLKRNSVKEFVDAIRTQDTYTFEKENNTLGPDLTNIFSNVSDQQKYIYSIIDRLKNGDEQHFILTTDEVNIIAKSKEELEKYLKLCDERLIRLDFLGYKVGLSISSKYRSSVGNKLSEKYKDELDFILIADCKREKFSTRTVNDLDLNKICALLGGGGHPKAAGFDMTDEALKLVSPYLDRNIINLKKNEDF